MPEYVSIKDRIFKYICLIYDKNTISQEFMHSFHPSKGVTEYLVCQSNDGTSCPKTVCPNTTLQFICNVETQQLGYTVWLLPNGTCKNNDDYTSSNRIAILQPAYAGCNPTSSSQHGTCGPFNAVTVASSGCVNSSLSVTATQALNGTDIKCMNYDGSNLFPVGNTTLSVIG